MAKKPNIQRYAQAIFELAEARKEFEQWQSDLARIARLAEEPSLIAFLDSPKFNFEDKVKILAENLKDINPLGLNLVYLLVSKGRFSIIGDIVDEYQRRLNSYRGIESAVITTAIPLDEPDRKKLAEHIEAVVGKKVVLTTKVDASLIGGITARVGGKLLDGSIQHRLEVLKKALAAGRS